MFGSYLVKQTMAYACKQVQDKEAKIQQLTYQSHKEQVHKMKSAPNPIKRSSDAVIDHVHSIIYLRQANEKKVYAFNLRMDSWKQLPDCNNFQCTLAFFEDNLLAIGGTPEDTSPRTSKVYKLVQQSGWETKSSMLTARSRTTALTCDFNKESVLIVAGGEKLGGDGKDKFESLNTVEVFKGQKWHPASQLPGTLCCSSGTVVKDYIHLVGGWSKRNHELLTVYTCRLSDLIESCDAPVGSAVWSQIIPSCPVAQTTCTTFQDKLLIVGGIKPHDPNKTPIDAIHIYNDHTNSWHIVGRLPEPRYLCFAMALCKCRFLVIGGHRDTSSFSKDVQIFM